MATWDIFPPLSALSRMVLVLFKKDLNVPHKCLEARLHMRGIVSELPEGLPFYICDENGERHKGVYVIGLLLWNKGNQPVTCSDFTESAPLQITIGENANLIKACIIPIEEQTVCSTNIVRPNTLEISFDCINPTEYLVLSIFITGNPMAEVNVTGRIIGQEKPIDHTAEEVRATMSDRISTFILLIFVINAVPGFVLGGWFIHSQYGLSVLWNNSNDIPKYLIVPFVVGAMMIMMFILSRIMYWVERRHVPKGYPVYADLEPRLLENIKGMLLTVFKGKKQRVSTSLFNWGKPILIPDKKVKRRTINDWIE